MQTRMQCPQGPPYPRVPACCAAFLIYYCKTCTPARPPSKQTRPHCLAPEAAFDSRRIAARHPAFHSKFRTWAGTSGRVQQQVGQCAVPWGIPRALRPGRLTEGGLQQQARDDVGVHVGKP